MASICLGLNVLILPYLGEMTSFIIWELNVSPTVFINIIKMVVTSPRTGESRVPWISTTELSMNRHWLVARSVFSVVNRNESLLNDELHMACWMNKLRKSPKGMDGAVVSPHKWQVMRRLCTFFVISRNTLLNTKNETPWRSFDVTVIVFDTFLHRICTN